MNKHQLAISTSTEEHVSEFMGKLITNGNNCWSFKTEGNSRYHTSRFNGISFRAHRLVWMLTNEKYIASDIVVRHKCDNSRCVNPHHLETGTQQDNIRDMHERGRYFHTPKRTHCFKGHLFTSETTCIRQDGKKVCRTCMRVNDKKRYNSERLKASSDYYHRNREAISLRRKAARRENLCSK